MNKILWEKILSFDLDEPVSEYGFSTRLANENFWTERFTADAVLEYKKFMYLAAVSELMVSPSEIVDIVWHEHLIFTNSYDAFCSVLGKKIAHLPSTHNRQEFDKFKQAKERTKQLYETNFGEQPADIWNEPDMYSTLELKKSGIKLRTLLLWCTMIFLLLVPAAYLLLKPVVSQIDNPYYLEGLFAVAVLSFICLEIYNKAKLESLLKTMRSDSFIFRLSAPEVIFAASENLNKVINWKINGLIESGKVYVEGTTLIPNINAASKDATEYVILETLRSNRSLPYSRLLQIFKGKPLFQNTYNAINALRKYFHKSVFFRKMFIVNFTTLSLVLMAALTRVLTGISRNKPVVFIMMAAFVILIASAVYLYRVTRMFTMKIIPSYYKALVKTVPDTYASDDWDYFIGSAVISASFMPVINRAERTGTSSDWSGSSSCGSDGGNSCGSSCGSSCGGCGGAIKTITHYF